MDPKIQQAWDDWRAGQECKKRIREGLAKMRVENETLGITFKQRRMLIAVERLVLPISRDNEVNT